MKIENYNLTSQIAGKLKSDLSKTDLDKIESLEYIKKYCLSNEKLNRQSLADIQEIVQRLKEYILIDTSILQKHIDNPNVTEIMVNNKDEIFIEENGEIRRVDDSFLNYQELDDVIHRIGDKINREISENSPILDARLENGNRVNAVYKNISGKSSVITIRKFQSYAKDIEFLIDKKTITRQCLSFLKELILAGYNIFISGGTSSGKTTFLRALISLIDEDERIIVIEDSRELNLEGRKNLIEMECRYTNNWSGNEIGMDKLIKTSLRMRPDRIIIGEIRDGKAMLNLINALNTGHSGMSTGHANSIEGMIRRLESFYMQETNFPIESIDEQIAQGIDIMVHLGKMGKNNRKILEVSELFIGDRGRLDINTLFKYDGKSLKQMSRELVKKERLELYHMNINNVEDKV